MEQKRDNKPDAAIPAVSNSWITSFIREKPDVIYSRSTTITDTAIRGLPTTFLYCYPVTILECYIGYNIVLPPIREPDSPISHRLSFGFDALIDIFSMNGHLFWCTHTDSDLIAP